jgi:hypothetical protein
MRTTEAKDAAFTNEEIFRAARRGVYEARKRHKERGHTVVQWNDGKVVHVPPDEIDLSWYEK